MIEVVPLLVVMVKLPAGSAVEPLAKVPEVQEAVAARLLTWTTWLPVVVPDAADALTMLELEEVTVLAESGPVTLFSDCMSLSRLVTLV